MCEEDLSHIMSFRENMLLYTNAEQQIISTMKNYGLMSQVITETPKSNIARRDAEQLIDHRSICSGTLDETSLQSLGAGLPPNDFAQKTEKTQKIQTLHQFINGDVWMFRFLMLFGIPGKEPKATVPNTYNFLMHPLPTA